MSIHKIQQFPWSLFIFLIKSCIFCISKWETPWPNWNYYIHRTYLYKGVHITNVLVIIVNKCSLFDKQHKQLIAPRTLSNFCGESRRPFMTPVQSKRVRSVHGTIIFMHQRFHEIFFLTNHSLKVADLKRTSADNSSYGRHRPNWCSKITWLHEALALSAWDNNI